LAHRAEFSIWLAGDFSASGMVIITLCVIAVLLAIIYMIAFWEGRAVSLVSAYRRLTTKQTPTAQTS